MSRHTILHALYEYPVPVALYVRADHARSPVARGRQVAGVRPLYDNERYMLYAEAGDTAAENSMRDGAARRVMSYV